MGKIKNWIEKFISGKEEESKIICAFCGKRIEETAFIMITGNIVVNDKSLRAPQVFTCLEQAFNYSQGFFAHSICWMNELKVKGVDLYDLDKVYEAYNKMRAASAPKFNNKGG